ncbi:MAG: hypothetical protein ACXWCZ_04640 [Flavisolibacter sp.]
MNKTSQKAPFFSKNRVGDVVMFVFFISSAILAIWGINLYRLTIIETRHFILPGIISGALMTLLVINIKTSYSKNWMIFQGMFCGICIAYFGLLFINHKYSEYHETTEEFEILEAGNLANYRRGRCSEPYARINFYGIKKELIFSCKYEKTIKKFSKVKLTYVKGKLGFPVIINQIRD